MNNSRETISEDEPAPFVGHWRNVYLFVAFELAATIATLYALTRWAS